MINFKSLKLKFIIIFIVFGLVPAVIVSVISTMNSSAYVTQKVYNQLTAINQIKKNLYKTILTSVKAIWEFL